MEVLLVMEVLCVTSLKPTQVLKDSQRSLDLLETLPDGDKKLSVKQQHDRAGVEL